MADPLTPTEIQHLSAPLCDAAAASLLDGTETIRDPEHKADIAMAVLVHQIGLVVGLVRLAYPRSANEVLGEILGRLVTGAVTVALKEADQVCGNFEVVGHG